MTDPQAADVRRPVGSPKARRTAARLVAVQALYQMEITGIASESVVSEFLAHRLGQSVDDEALVEPDPQLFADIVRGVGARRGELDPHLGDALDRPLARVEALLRAIMRAGAWEILARAETPASIIINDYVDVGHAFFAGKEPGMVNAVLDRLARTLRPEEMAAREGGKA